MQNPDLIKKLRSEIKEKIVNPYLANGGAPNPHLLDVLTYENSSDLTYFGYCFYESLRIEPPVHFSSTLAFTEDVELGKYTVRKND